MTRFRSGRDPATGHEFFIGQPVSGCSGSGWIMVSTRNTCAYEAGTNPGFYYSSTGTTSNFNSGELVRSWLAGCLSVCMPAGLSFCLNFPLSVCLPVYLPACLLPRQLPELLSVFFLPVCMPAPPPHMLNKCLPVCLSTCVAACPLSFCV